MSVFTITLDPATARFYEHVAQRAQLPVETVLSDTLFKLAGELALEALSHTKRAEH